MSIALGLRMKADNSLIRVWVAKRSEDIERIGVDDLTVKVAQNNYQTGDVPQIRADVAVENQQGVEKGRLGWGMFCCLYGDLLPQLSPPFWWRTGFDRLDRLTKLKQGEEHRRNRSRTAG